MFFFIGKITGNTAVKVGGNTSLLGKAGSCERVCYRPRSCPDEIYTALEGVGLSINGVNNVIVRNLKISKVRASAGDAVGVQKANKIWLDHLDLSSNLDNGKDLYVSSLLSSLSMCLTRWAAATTLSLTLPMAALASPCPTLNFTIISRLPSLAILIVTRARTPRLP